MNWNGRKVLVTGGAGFLGSNLCRALAKRGSTVSTVDAFLCEGGANAANLEGIQVNLVRADIRDFDLRPLCEGVEVIFNLAALTSHMGGQQNPLADIAVNVVAQIRMIEAVREVAPEAIVVHASTRQFYGRAERLPVKEDQLVTPTDTNGITKFAGEQYWMVENRVTGQPVVSLRLTNCYGPRQRIRDARQNFLGVWILSAIEGRPFEVWGGAQLRDLAYVDDVTDAFLAAAATPACHGHIFNIGGAPPLPVRDIADRLVHASHNRTRYTVCEFPADRARIDIGSYYADDSSFREATGWTTKVGLEEGLCRTIEWFEPRIAAYR
ncbi:MAG TPA: NAD-dependent epimerase/dehydratase family protein [Acidobacteriaceae bacterium]|jgi:UDP-glucose 4-epimerase